MQDKDIKSLVQELCLTIISDKTTLGITKDEAMHLLENVVKSNDFIEELRRTQNINREIYIVRKLAFRKYFETLGHNGIVERMTFDNSSKFAFSGDGDGIIKCWNIEKGMLIRSFYGHNNMISDLCISKDGKIMVSVDYQGKLNIWSLNTFKILHSIQLSNEAIFCEFIYKLDQIQYEIFIILANGNVKTIQFTEYNIVNEKDNSFMRGESIKAICITDGGRFVICGGWWPFFLIYDTQDLNSIIVVENFRIQTLCAAKNALKFSASSENKIYSYTFYCEGKQSGDLTKSKSGIGYWKRHLAQIADDFFIEWLCYLPSFLLIASCTDNIIRIYEEDVLLVSFKSEVGSVYSHPFRNIFAVVGTKLQIYEMIDFDNLKHEMINHDGIFYEYKECGKEEPDFEFVNFSQRGSENRFYIKKIFSENIYINLNDCQFSEDGRFLVTCDDQGYIRAYSVESPIEIPEEQFFKKDIEISSTRARANNLNNFAARITITGEFSAQINAQESVDTLSGEDTLSITNNEIFFEETYNINSQKNSKWIKTDYSLTEVNIPNNIKIENCAALSLEKDKLDESNFQKLYLYNDQTVLSGQDNNLEDTIKVESNDKTYIISESNENSNHDSVDNHYSSSSSSLEILRRKSKDKIGKKKRKKPKNAIEYLEDKYASPSKKKSN